MNLQESVKRILREELGDTEHYVEKKDFGITPVKDKVMKFKKPNFDFEWDEAQRYPEFEKMGKDGWIQMAQNGSIVRFSEIEDVLGNVDLDFNNLDIDKKVRFKKAIKIGRMELPIAVKFDEESYDLIGGNTRLSGLVSMGIDSPLWIVDLSEKEDVIEELGDIKSNYQKQVELIEKLLYSKSYEGVCGFRFIEDEDDDRVRSIMIKFSEEWYRTDNDSLYLNKKLQLIQETKKKVADIIERYLNLDDIFVGSYLQECNLSLNEQQDTKSNYEKQVAVLKILLKSKSYDGLCGYSFTPDSDNDEVGSVILKFSSKWYRLSDDQLMALSQVEDDIRDISKKFLGMENLNFRYYSEDCDSSLNEQEQPKDAAFQKALKKVIPDNSIYKTSFYVPNFSDRGYTHVMMKYSVLPESRLEKVQNEYDNGAEVFWDGIHLELQIHELSSKTSKFEDFYGGYKPVQKLNDIDEKFWQRFEDDLGDKIRRSLGIDSVVTYYKFPDTMEY